MEDVIIEQAQDVSESDMMAIAKLIATLKGEPVRPIEEIRQLVEQVLRSDQRVLLVARWRGAIVGIATLSLMIGIAAGRTVYLNEFVTDEAIRRKGVGSKLWQVMLDWSRQHDATMLVFTSNPKRQDAHRFYSAKGATIYDTRVFNKLL